MAANTRPIIVIKKKGGHGGGHHGGAWKVAYADFVTAMMSLFIVLWLLNSTPQVKKAVAGYFNDPKGNGQSTGTGTKGAGDTLTIDKSNVQNLKEQIENAIKKQVDLSKLSKNIEITLTGEGLRIELIEGHGETFFENGSAKPNENGVKLLVMLAAQLSKLPNRVFLEGHTDAKPYAGDNGYSNWELSTDRANAARKLLQENGVGPQQISQVRGFADQRLRAPDNPFDASNRRISLIVQWEPGSPEAAKEEGKHEAKEGEGSKKETAPEKKTAEPAKPGDAHPTEAPVEPKASAATEPIAKPEAAKPASPAPKPSLMDRMKGMIPGKKK